MRPLGIPSLHFRILTSMWALFLQAVIDPTLGLSHHGFRPGKSVVSAVKDVARNWMENEVRYEFDLVACFNKLEIRAVDQALKALKIPTELINYIR